MDHLGVFAKYWQSGTVKTRLGQEVGLGVAADLYRLMLESTLEKCSELGDHRRVVYDPPERGGEFVAVAGSRCSFSS